MFKSAHSNLLITIVTTWITGSFLYGNTQDLKPMEVSALRLDTSPQNLPARIQVIDQAKIEQSGATDIVGLLRKEANLQVRSYIRVIQQELLRFPWEGFGENGGLANIGPSWTGIDSTPSICLQSTGTPYPWHLVESIEVIRGGAVWNLWQPCGWRGELRSIPKLPSN